MYTYINKPNSEPIGHIAHPYNWTFPLSIISSKNLWILIVATPFQRKVTRYFTAIFYLSKKTVGLCYFLIKFNLHVVEWIHSTLICYLVNRPYIPVFKTSPQKTYSSLNQTANLNGYWPMTILRLFGFLKNIFTFALWCSRWHLCSTNRVIE